jgi:hypothetical protein
VPQPQSPLSSVSFADRPINCSFALLQVIFVLSLVVLHPRLPEELAHAMHFSIFPFAIVTLATEPSVPTMAIKLVLLKLPNILFFEFGSTHVLKYEFCVLSESNALDFLGGTLPRKFVFELISDYLLKL